MKKWTFGAAAVAALSICLSGCGGGGGNGNNITKDLLATASSRQWLTKSLKANSNYNGTGGDQACAVEITDKNDSENLLSCTADDKYVFRADNTFSASTGGTTTLAGTWSLSGSELTITYTVDSTTYVDRLNVTLLDSVGGRIRVRLRAIFSSENGTRDTYDDGVEVVLEEVPPT